MITLSSFKGHIKELGYLIWKTKFCAIVQVVAKMLGRRTSDLAFETSDHFDQETNMSACFFNLFLRSSHKPSRPIKTAGKVKKKKVGTLLKIVLH